MKPIPFIVLVDSREQTPLDFVGAPTRRATLKSGDYSLIWDGHDLRDFVAIERKSATDLLGCVGHDRDRFTRELERLSKLPHRALVIENSLREVLSPSLSAIHPSAVLGSLCAWAHRYGVWPIFAGDRALAAQITLKLLIHGAQTYTACTD
jgi:DNA excision repair protein ERCC-4